MRFKEWLENSMGMVTQYLPGEDLNTGLPVRSKISAKSNSSAPEEDRIDADAMFGIRTHRDKRRTQEREAGTIDNAKRKVPLRVPVPDIIY